MSEIINDRRLESYKADARKAVDMAYQAGMNDEREYRKKEKDALVAALEEIIPALESAYGLLSDQKMESVCIDPWGVLKDSKQTLAAAKGETDDAAR